FSPDPSIGSAAAVALPANPTVLPGTREGVAREARAMNQRMAAAAGRPSPGFVDRPSPGFEVIVSAANMRAWVSWGPIITTLRRHQGGWVSCKLPGPDGYNWGWVHSYDGGYHEGWMRSDLYVVFPTASQPSTWVPWC